MICAPPFLYFIVSTSVGRCFGGDYCQPKDLLCGNEGRKARFPTLRIGDLHFAELIMLIHDLLSKNLLRTICQTARDSQL